MSILILEPSGYSEKAISLYSKIGEVYLNFDQAELNTVEILVVRLNYKIGSKLCDQLENLKLVATPTGKDIVPMTFSIILSAESSDNSP